MGVSFRWTIPLAPQHSVSSIRCPPEGSPLFEVNAMARDPEFAPDLTD
jgi:hypothetical protein